MACQEEVVPRWSDIQEDSALWNERSFAYNLNSEQTGRIRDVRGVPKERGVLVGSIRVPGRISV